MSRFLIAPLALALGVLGTSPARADNVSFGGFANGYETVSIAVTAPNSPTMLSTEAGGFLTSLNGSPSFTAYCIDLYQTISFCSTYSDYTLTSGAAHAFSNANALADIGKLYAEGNVVNNAQTQAAFQIAIWEIAYETTGVYDLASGSAAFSGGTAASSGALSLAGSWLGALANTTNTTYAVMALNSPGHQDQVFAAPVPEPSSYALMTAGLLCMGFVARRRAARQA